MATTMLYTILVLCNYAIVSKALGQRDEVVVLGVHLTEIGATCAVSLPDGSYAPLASVQGGPRYQDLMASWYAEYHHASDVNYAHPTSSSSFGMPEAKKLCSVDSRRTIIEDSWWQSFTRAEFSRWIASKLGWTRRDANDLHAPDYYLDDQATTVLKETLRYLYSASTSVLLNIGAINDTSAGNYFTDVALPAWFFCRYPYFVGDPDGYGVDTACIRPLTNRVSAAMYLAGFGQSNETESLGTLRKHDRDPRDHTFRGPFVAPQHVAIPDLPSACYISTLELKRCRCLPERLRIPPIIAMAVFDLQVAADQRIYLSLWIQLLKETCIGLSTRYWSVQGLFDVTNGSSSGWQALLAPLATQLDRTLGLIQHTTEGMYQVLLSGDSWSPNATRGLEAELAAVDWPYELRDLHVEKGGFAVALKVAEQARTVYDGYGSCSVAVDSQSWWKHFAEGLAAPAEEAEHEL